MEEKAIKELNALTETYEKLARDYIQKLEECREIERAMIRLDKRLAEVTIIERWK